MCYFFGFNKAKWWWTCSWPCFYLLLPFLFPLSENSLKSCALGLQSLPILSLLNSFKHVLTHQRPGSTASGSLDTHVAKPSHPSSGLIFLTYWWHLAQLVALILNTSLPLASWYAGFPGILNLLTVFSHYLTCQWWGTPEPNIWTFLPVWTQSLGERH